MTSRLIQSIRSWSSKQIFIILAAFLVYFLADGVTFSFGLYVDELISEYSQSKANIVLRTSIVAALTQSVPLLLSPLVCFSTTKFGASIASLIGCIFAASGYILPFILQFSKTFWIPAVGYGCLLSVGLSFCYVPAYLTLPFHFEDDRGLASGLAVSGSGVGQVVLAIIIKIYMIEYGWRGASLITGGLFLFMLISVLAFRKPTFSSSSLPLPIPETEATENPTVPSLPAAINKDQSREGEEESTVPSSGISSHPRRSRGMTIAQVLPIFISSVPVRVGVTMPSIEQRVITRRLSLHERPRTHTLSVEPSTIHLKSNTNFQRARANTIAVPLQIMRPLDRSLEQFRTHFQSPPLPPIISTEEEVNEQEEQEANVKEEKLSLTSSISSQKQIETQNEPFLEKHWIFNGRFILFCISNFALCLVLGVPYVIIPTYISETFHNQNYLSSWTLSSVGIASAIGQILLGYLHDRKICQAWFMYALAVIISGVSLIILALFRYKIIVLVCAFMYGLAISANYALQVLIVIEALSMENMTNAFGILQFCQGVSTLIGIPLQGLLRDLSHTYKLSFLTSGCIIIFSGLIMFLWPCLKITNRKEKNKTDIEE